jgi:uncharacterized damage-inducible protein DinB
MEIFMTISQSLLGEFDQEMASTQKMLERFPEGKSEWRPHAKSMTMGHAGHTAEVPWWASETMRVESMEPDKSYKPVIATSREQILKYFHENVKNARAAIAKASDEELMKQWSFIMDGKPLFVMPRIAVLRTFVMNHMIHHRAQLTVYYRMNDIPVPAIYGPSADEQA